jgi:hypothetical protein
MSIPVMDAPIATGEASAQAAIRLPLRMYGFENAGRAEAATGQSNGK